MNDFEEYVRRYSRKHEITPEEAKEHALVKEVKAYYEERDRGLYAEKKNDRIPSPQEAGLKEV